MQSENGILLLFYIFLSHGNEKKKKKNGKRVVGCKKGGCCVLSTSTCGENHRPVTSQTLSHNVVSSTHRLGVIRTHNFSDDRY